MSPTYFNSNFPSGKKISEAIDRLKARKAAMRLSNKQISENSNGLLSESAVQRFFSGESADPSMLTFIEVSTAMGMTLIEAFGETVPAKTEHHIECAAVRTHFEARLSDAKEQYKEHIAELKDLHAKELTRISRWLVLVTSAFLLLVVGVLVFTAVDITNHDVGWIRYDEYLRMLAENTTTTNGVIDFLFSLVRGVLNGKL